MPERSDKSAITRMFYNFRALHWRNDLRRPAINTVRDCEAGLAKDHLNLEPHDTVLTIGIGTADDEMRMNIPAATLDHISWIGIDLSDAMLSVAQKTMPNINLVQANLLEPFRHNGKQKYARLPIAQGSMNACFCHHVLCHLPVLDPIVKDVFRVLKPGGRFVFHEFVEPTEEMESVPNAKPIFPGNYPRHKEKTVRVSLIKLDNQRFARDYVTSLAQTGFTISAYRYVTADSVFISALKS